MTPATLSALVSPVHLAFLGMGFTELLLVAFVALLVFGGDLPDVMRSLGRSYGRLRAALHDLSRPVREEFHRVRDLRPPPDTVAHDDAVAHSETPDYPDPPAAGEDAAPHAEAPGTAPEGATEGPPEAEAGAARPSPLDEPPPV